MLLGFKHFDLLLADMQFTSTARWLDCSLRISRKMGPASGSLASGRWSSSPCLKTCTSQGFLDLLKTRDLDGSDPSPRPERVAALTECARRFAGQDWTKKVRFVVLFVSLLGDYGLFHIWIESHFLSSLHCTHQIIQPSRMLQSGRE